MRPKHSVLVGVASILMLFSVGCEDVKARKMVKEGNDLYRNGEYKAAVDKYNEAEKLNPNLEKIYINRAYACLQQFSAGANTPENNKAAECALASYGKFLEFEPGRRDVRDLRIQLWLDSGHYDDALNYFKAVIDKDPKNLDAVKTIGIIYAKMPGKFQDALNWYEKRANLEPDNPEGWYAVGTLIWEQLFHHHPPDAQNPTVVDAILGPQRLAMADHGIHALEKALKINTNYTDAYTYTNLLFRERALGHENASTDPKQAEYVQEDLKKADENMKKALELLRKAAGQAPKK
jgi:tetratricopeptide (TPR) repeat protein